MLIVAAPMLSRVGHLQPSFKQFSVFGLSGPNLSMQDNPSDIRVGEVHHAFLRVDNHMGCSKYYLIYVKLRNQTQPLLDISGSMPSPLPPLFEFRFFVADGGTWESSLTFAFENVSFQGDSMYVGSVSINDVTFPVGSTSMWDSKNSGFYYQLFFELWHCDLASQSLQFHNRFVWIWLNATAQ
jgi:hypothetical protein